MKFLNVLLFIFSTLFVGQGSAETESTRKLLFDTLRPVLSESLKEGRKVIRYCPDNLCLLVESSNDVKSDLLYEFTIMFFFYEADFPEFREKNYLLPTGISPQNKFKTIAPELIKKYISDCCEDAQDKNVCVLQNMRNKYGIKTHFSRTDEGHSIKEEK